MHNHSKCLINSKQLSDCLAQMSVQCLLLLLSIHCMDTVKTQYISQLVEQTCYSFCYLCVWLFILAMDLHTEREIQYSYTHIKCTKLCKVLAPV